MAKKSKKLRGKKWFRLKAPDMFDGKDLGEGAAQTEEDMIGRTVEVGATDLVKSSRKYYFKVKFKVDKVSGDKARCRFIGHECSRDFITRMIRKRSKRIDDRTKVKTKDDVKVIVKTVCATIKSVGASTQTAIRKDISKNLKETASDTTLDKFIKSIFSGKIQKQLKESGDKIYPLRGIEIRKTEVID